jgi:UDP-glucose 4-epimerase
MRVLITGITGRIGRQAAETFIEAGYDVVGFSLPDDPGIRSWLERGVAIHEGALEDYDSVQRAVENADAIVHLGALMSWSPGDNPKIFDINARGTFNLLETSARKGGVHRFILASSGQVYPDDVPCYRPVDEAHPRRPYSFYGLTKQLGEDMCAFYYRNHGVPTVVARFTPTFQAKELLDPLGPHTAHRFFLKQKIKKMIEQYNASPSEDLRKSIDILKSVDTESNQLVIVRDMNGNAQEMAISDARDTSAGLLLMIEKQAAVGETFNLGPETSWSFEGIVKHMSKLTGLPIADVNIPLPSVKLQNSIAKARTLLDYQPQYTIYEMLDESYHYWESYRNVGFDS